MISLSSAQFKPMAILISVAFLPFIIFGSIFVLLQRTIGAMIVFMSLSCVYALCMVICRKCVKSEKYYLMLHERYLEIVYPNIGSGKGKINIEYDKIIRFEYYKITSIRAWLQLYNYVTPQCVYITYTDDEKEKCELMGYMNFDDIRKISSEYEMELKVY